MPADNRPSVLLLGADKYIVRACARRGVDTVVVLGSGAYDYGLARIPDDFRLVRVDDQTSPEAVLMALHRAGLAGHRFDAVQTTDEWALVNAGVLAAEFGARAIDPAIAVRFRDKSVQKEYLRAAGVPVARCQVIEDVHDVSAITELPFEHGVLKPIAGAATARTSTVHSLADLRARSAEYRAEHTAQRTFLLEEYVAAQEEWLIDGFVFDGELVFFAMGRYDQPCLTVITNNQPFSMLRLAPDTDADAYTVAEPVVRAALTALGLRDGVFHMELFHDTTTGEVTFGECAARRGGGLVHEEVQAKFNVDLCDSALLCALGHRPDPLVKIQPEVIGSTYLPGRPGILVDGPTPDEVLALPDVRFARLECAPGTRFSAAVGSTNQRAGQVMAAAESEELLLHRLADIREWFDRRISVLPDGATTRELRTWQAARTPGVDWSDPLWG